MFLGASLRMRSVFYLYRSTNHISPSNLISTNHNLSSSLLFLHHQQQRTLFGGRIGEYFRTKQPRIYEVKQLVAQGSRETVNEIKTFFVVGRALRKGKQLSELSRKELEALLLAPQDIGKLLIISVLIVLPFSPILLGAALLLFPRQVLTRHFWSATQRPLFYDKSLDKSHWFFDDDLSNQLHRLDQSKHLLNWRPMKIEHVISHALPVFKDPTLFIENLPGLYRYVLARIHGVFPVFRTRKSLHRHAMILVAHNQLLQRNGVDEMSRPELELAHFIRRMRFRNLTDAELRNNLRIISKLSPSADDAVFLPEPSLLTLMLHLAYLLTESEKLPE